MVSRDLFDLKGDRFGTRHLALTDDDEYRLRAARRTFTDHNVDLSDGSNHAGGRASIHNVSLYTANEDPDLVFQWGRYVSDNSGIEVLIDGRTDPSDP